jgi:hypothetical protein
MIASVLDTMPPMMWGWAILICLLAAMVPIIFLDALNERRQREEERRRNVVVEIKERQP